MSITPYGQLVFSVPELFAIGMALIVIVHFLRKPDLVKARIFLNFEAFRRFFLVILAIGALAISASTFMALSGAYGTDFLESWDAFGRLEAPTVVIFLVVGLWVWEIRRTLR